MISLRTIKVSFPWDTNTRTSRDWSRTLGMGNFQSPTHVTSAIISWLAKVEPTADDIEYDWISCRASHNPHKSMLSFSDFQKSSEANTQWLRSANKTGDISYDRYVCCLLRIGTWRSKCTPASTAPGLAEETYSRRTTPLQSWHGECHHRDFGSSWFPPVEARFPEGFAPQP